MLIVALLAAAPAAHGANAAAGAPAAASAAASAAEAAKADTVVAIGLPSLIEQSRGPLGTGEVVCVDFAVQAIGAPLARLRLSTTGIGHAWLLDRSTHTPDCESSVAPAAATLVLDDVRELPRRVRLVLEADAFPSVAAKGKLLMLRDGLPAVEAEVTLQRQDHAPVTKALLWVLGLLVPALLTGWIGLSYYKRQKRVDTELAENAAFERYKRDRGPQLSKFFGATGKYAAAAANPDQEEYVAFMRQALGSEQIPENLPRAANETLMTAVLSADRDKVVDSLCTLFPDDRDAILRSRPPKP